MATFLLEWRRDDQNSYFRPGGVAAEGGETRYCDESGLMKFRNGPCQLYDDERPARFQHDIAYFHQWYVVDRGMSWRECFIRMSQHGIVGYFVWRVAIDLPDEATLDDVFDWYMVKGRTDEFRPAEGS